MGTKNIPLNEIGKNEALITKEKLSKYKFYLIICSPLDRTKETANIINSDKKVRIIYDDRIMERNLGNLEGKPYTNDNDILWDININTSNYGVETMEDFKKRVYEFMDEIVNNYSNQNILVVTHGGVSALINCYMNNTLYDGPISDKFLANCSVATYDIKKNKVIIKK